MTIAGMPVQAAEGEKDVVVAQADGNVSQDSVDRANELLNAMSEKVLESFCDNGWKFYVTEGQSWMLPDLSVQRKTTNGPI